MAQAGVCLEIRRVGGLVRLLGGSPGGGAEHPRHLAQGFGAQGGVPPGASPGITPDPSPRSTRSIWASPRDHLDADFRTAALEGADEGWRRSARGTWAAAYLSQPWGEGGGHDGLVGGLQAVQHGGIFGHRPCLIR